MKTVREMFVSLTAMLINHIWASIIEICVEKWRTQSLKKIEIQMSRHEKRYRSEEMSPVSIIWGKLKGTDRADLFMMVVIRSDTELMPLLLITSLYPRSPPVL